MTEELIGKALPTVDIIDDKLYTVEEMAEFLSMGTGTLKDWTKQKDDPCPCFRKGAKFLRFEKSAVLSWLRRQSLDEKS